MQLIWLVTVTAGVNADRVSPAQRNNRGSTRVRADKACRDDDEVAARRLFRDGLDGHGRGVLVAEIANLAYARRLGQITHSAVSIQLLYRISVRN